MNVKKSTKGFTFKPVGNLSPEAKVKIDALMKKKAERLNKVVEDYNTGRLVIQ